VWTLALLFDDPKTGYAGPSGTARPTTGACRASIRPVNIKQALEEVGIALALPIRHVARVFPPLHALEPGELGDEILAQRRAQHRVGLQRIDGGAQVLR